VTRRQSSWQPRDADAAELSTAGSCLFNSNNNNNNNNNNAP